MTKPTRADQTTGKEAMLDPVITTLSQYYQEPTVLAPLDPDPEKDGKPADHGIVVINPVSTINNKSSRVTKVIRFRPITDSGMQNMQNWLIGEDWTNDLMKETSDDKANEFQKVIQNKYDECFPEKVVQISNDDQPWITNKIKELDRKRNKIYITKTEDLKSGTNLTNCSRKK